jgi:Predicted permeases
MVLSLLGMALYQCLAYYAAATISVLTMGIIMSIIPLLTILLSIFILKTPPTQGVLIGSILSFIGLIWLISGGEPTRLLELGIGQGEILMLMAALSYALYGVLTKKWTMKITNWHSVYVQKWTMKITNWHSVYVQILFGTLMLLPGFLMSNDLTINSDNVWLVLYAGIPASIIAPFVWIIAIKKLGANKTALFLNLTPVITAIISILFLHETLCSYHLIGGGMSFIGVILAQNLKTPLFKMKASDKDA